MLEKKIGRITNKDPPIVLLYALGANRGGIDERWFFSTVQADNIGAPEDEGLSYIVIDYDSEIRRVPLRDAISDLGETFLGKEMMRKHGRWPVFSKFFDKLFEIHQK